MSNRKWLGRLIVAPEAYEPIVRVVTEKERGKRIASVEASNNNAVADNESVGTLLNCNDCAVRDHKIGIPAKNVEVGIEAHVSLSDIKPACNENFTLHSR